jgi:2-succinyl-5-enolpyruvyl-6-hydroxy-3-cyclohexene-1-carboxylate synthase
MTRPNPSTALAEVIVDELARNGVRLVVASPGSRSAALVIAASRHPALETVMALDERSAAFHALGRAKTAGEPAAVVSTSGTAPANWYPAVVEADMSLTPLILVSADRPAEMRGIGANQTIDQMRLFGDRVRLFTAIEAPADDDLNDEWRRTICRAISASRGLDGRPGPAHVNVAFREPTVPVADDGRTMAGPYPHPIEGRVDGGPWVEADVPAPGDPIRIPFSMRGLVIAGEGAYDGASLLEEATRLGWPVVATALSGLRGKPVVDAYHHMLAGDLPEHLRPELVVAVGSHGPSERLDRLFALGRHRVRIDRWGRAIDPGLNTTLAVSADPVAVLGTVEPDQEPDPGWSASWIEAGRRVRQALIELLSASSLTGAGVATALDRVDWGCLVVGSSLPIREIDAHITRAGPVVANRGASGIDGMVSTALGAASVMERTVGVIGDLSLLHDGNGYLCDRVGDLVMVVVNNGGGGLFDSLPPATHAPDYERLFVTPQRRDLALFADFHGLEYRAVADIADLLGFVESLLSSGGLSLVEVPVDRAVDLSTRRALDVVGRSALVSSDA